MFFKKRLKISLRRFCSHNAPVILRTLPFLLLFLCAETMNFGRGTVTTPWRRPAMDVRNLFAKDIKGFLAEDEAIRMYEIACEAGRLGPCLEIGSYCGRATAFLGFGCRKAGCFLYSVDHHQGSEEQQPGQAYFDPELFDVEKNRIDTLPFLLRTITELGLVDTVLPIVGRSESIASFWKKPLALILIDGGHSFAAAFADYSGWVSHLLPGGYLLIHDVFPDPAQGGQAPRCIYEMALSSGLFHLRPMVNTLGILKRAAPGEITETAGKRRKDSA